MAFMGNMTTATANEINPNNFAARPGMIANNAPKPENDYLFGANMGHTHLENNLNISKSVIKTRLPVSFPRIGMIDSESINTLGMIVFVGGIVHGLANASDKDASIMQTAAIMGTGLLLTAISKTEEAGAK